MQQSLYSEEEKMEIIPYERSVYYYETDKMAIVHHSNYIRWFEEARVDFLRQIGLPFEKIEERGLLVPVLGISARYLLPFRYGDVFQIHIKVVSFTGLKFSIAYEVYHKETGKLHVTGTSEHGFVDSEMKPVRLKREYPDIYEAFATYAQ